MILDTLENASPYFTISPGVAVALRFLKRPDLATLAPGSHALDGQRIYAMVQEYQTRHRDKGIWEAHRRYIDVQFVQTGVEAMGWAPIQQMSVKQEYDSEKDYLLFDGAGQTLHVPAGSFAIFMPHDVHMPCLAVDDRPLAVRKIVIKVAVE